jgi:sugar fermentation stimulation protein A
LSKLSLFSPDLQGTFTARPNRFTVLVDGPEGEISAHCPNPGRMRELLLPGRRCFLEYKPSAGRKTAYTLVAVEYGERIIPLYSAGANRIARELLLPRLFPRAESIRPEYSVGSSRFDFLISQDGRKTLVEVKSCTLVEEETAMFPDAPSLRGTRHIEELLRLGNAGLYRGMVLFVVANPDARRLVPGIHTDPAFAEAAARASGTIRFHAASISCSASGEAELSDADLPVDFGPCDAAVKDSGVYLLRLLLRRSRRVAVGALGELQFPAGVYIYVGSGKASLQKRIDRHLRRRKRMHWHIDYLLEAADAREAFPVRTLKDLECTLADEIAATGAEGIPGFGSSDCGCRTHLFRLREGGEDQLFALLLKFRHRIAL